MGQPRSQAIFSQAVLGWSQPLPNEQHAKPSAALLKECAEVRKAYAQGQPMLLFSGGSRLLPDAQPLVRGPSAGL